MAEWQFSHCSIFGQAVPGMAAIMLPQQEGMQGPCERTCEALHSIQLSEQLVNNPVSDSSGVMAPLGSNGVELIKEHDTRRCCLSPPVTHPPTSASAPVRQYTSISAVSGAMQEVNPASCIPSSLVLKLYCRFSTSHQQPAQVMC